MRPRRSVRAGASGWRARVAGRSIHMPAMTARPTPVRREANARPGLCRARADRAQRHARPGVRGPAGGADARGRRSLPGLHPLLAGVELAVPIGRGGRPASIPGPRRDRAGAPVARPRAVAPARTPERGRRADRRPPLLARWLRGPCAATQPAMTTLPDERPRGSAAHLHFGTCAPCRSSSGPPAARSAMTSPASCAGGTSTSGPRRPPRHDRARTTGRGEIAGAGPRRSATAWHGGRPDTRSSTRGCASLRARGSCTTARD